MPKHTNFYETTAEAEMRLLSTIVMYDDEPYYVVAISDHKNDGIFRIYLDRLGTEKGLVSRHDPYIPCAAFPGGGAGPSLGKKMDEWLDANPDKGIIRKMMNSPAFNKYRPFPLGMCNYLGQAIYVERSPTRHTQQGLTSQMLSQTVLSMDMTPMTSSKMAKNRVDFFHYSFYQTIKGVYPTPDECLKNLLDDKISNASVGFHRLFALVRGPMDLIFLAYKGDVVGILPDNDFSKVRLDKKFYHTRELIHGLNLFGEIK